MGYAGFEGIRYLRYTATISNEFKSKMAHLQRSNCSINTNLNILAYVASINLGGHKLPSCQKNWQRSIEPVSGAGGGFDMTFAS